MRWHSFRRGLDEAGGLDVDEALFGEIVAGDAHDLGPREDVAHEVRAAQVEIAVLQSQLRLDVALFDDGERRGLRGREDFQRGDVDLDFPGRQVRVDRRLAAGTDDAAGAEDVFGADAEREVENLAFGALVEGELHDAGAVAQIDEDEGAKVSLALAPAVDDNLFADVRCGQGAAVNGSFIVFRKGFHFDSVLSVMFDFEW